MKTKKLKAIPTPKVLKLKSLTEQKNSNYPVDHLSCSSLSLFSTNPILFKIKYINGDRYETTNGISGILGRAFHSAMEVYFRGNPDMMPKDESEAIQFGLQTGLDFLTKYEEGFIEYSKEIPVRQKALDRFSFGFTSYVKEHKHNPKEIIVAVEDEIEEDVQILWRGQELTLPVKLKGYVDKIVRIEDKLKIIDYKTCSRFSDPEKIDGHKIIQAVQYYLLAYAKYEQEPYSIIFEETKLTKNEDGSPQTRRYEVVFKDNELYFDFYFRLYEDVVNALAGKMVYVPNIHTFYDNEVAMIAYIHRLDVDEEKAEEMRKLKVSNISELLRKKVQTQKNVKQFLRASAEKFVSAKSINYDNMKNEQKIKTKLMEHGMVLEFEKKIEGPTVDLYCFAPSIGLKMSRIKSFATDVEQVLGVTGVRVLAPIPNSSLIGFEVPKKNRYFPDLPEYRGFNLSIGQSLTGETREFDPRTAPHMIVAGSAGSGKSVFLNTLIEQLSQNPEVELYLFDPKQVEMMQYAELATKYETDHNTILLNLDALCAEMEDRYKIMKRKKVKHIAELKGNMKYKFVIIDEFADLTMRENIQQAVQMLAQKGRACGIHLIIATQRASTRVISGDTKVNFPVKVVFRMAKEADSRVMLDEGGAEKLLGKGDMLFATETGIERLQGFH